VVQSKLKGVVGRVSHFSFATVFNSDWAMRECLQMGGQWAAVSRDSDEFRAAQLRFDVQAAKKLLDKSER
jgi:hypothetical protein